MTLHQKSKEDSFPVHITIWLGTWTGCWNNLYWCWNKKYSLIHKSSILKRMIKLLSFGCNLILHLIFGSLDIHLLEEMKSKIVYLMVKEDILLLHHFPIPFYMKQQLKLEDNFHYHHCTVHFYKLKERQSLESPIHIFHIHHLNILIRKF